MIEQRLRAAGEAEKLVLEKAKSDDPDALASVQSLLIMRLLVGVLGVLMPFVLLIGDSIVDSKRVGTRGSLSAYYHTGARDYFVSVLVVVGITLIIYKYSQRNVEFWLSALAGLLAIGVALFPTKVPAGMDVEPTPFQMWKGQDWIGWVHFSCASLFIVLLGRFCFDFARKELDKPDFRLWKQKFHRGAGIAIIVAIGFIGLMFAAEWLNVLQKDDFLVEYKLYLGESLAVFAFGGSWLIEGANRELLRKKIVYHKDESTGTTIETVE